MSNLSDPKSDNFMRMVTSMIKQLPDETNDITACIADFHHVVAKWKQAIDSKAFSIDWRSIQATQPIYWKINLILSVLGQEDIRQSFEAHGISDIWLPLSRQTLRRVIKSNEYITFFLQCQEQVLDTELRLRDVAGTSSLPGLTHSTIEDDEDLVTESRHLGEGAFGTVDEIVVSTRAGDVVCVRKRIGRSKIIKAQIKVNQAFMREINVMHQVDYHHCVRIIGSYTDPEHVNIISLPVAELDLAQLLDQPMTMDIQKILYQGMSCLCNAVNYLHTNNIRHEDLKPQNVLILDGHVLLTDFGFSLDFSDDTASTTTGRPSAWTIRYSAPEVLNFEPRNRATDVFSLGCILIEMISGICGCSLTQIKDHWKQHGTHQSSFAQNPEATELWMTSLRSRMLRRELEMIYPICDYASLLLDTRKECRPTASQIVDRLLTLKFLLPKSRTLLQLGLNICLGCYDHPSGYQPSASASERLGGLLTNDFVLHSIRHGFLPWLHADRTYGIWDLELNLLYSQLNYAREELMLQNVPSNHHERFIQGLKYHFGGFLLELYNTANRYGMTSKFWKAHAERKQKTETPSPQLREHALLSAKMASLQHLVYRNLVASKTKTPRVGLKVCPIQLFLLPICLARSPFYGEFFFMISYQGRMDANNCYLSDASGIVDLTL